MKYIVNKTQNKTCRFNRCGTGKLQQLREWWDKIGKLCTLLRSYPNAPKSWLIVKSHQETLAKHTLNDTEFNITIQGRKYLGGYI